MDWLPENAYLTPRILQAPKIVQGTPIQGMSCEEGMRLLNSKIQNSYRNLRAAFHAMDRDSDGLVNRTDLVALLTKLLIPMKREDINDMWAKISGGMLRAHFIDVISYSSRIGP